MADAENMESRKCRKNHRRFGSTTSAALAVASSQAIVHPETSDILLGRGSANSTRPGNAHLYKVVEEYLNEYHSTTSRRTKGFIIQTIFERVQSIGCRFIRKNPDTCAYYQVDEAQAKEKISHTLRDRRNHTSWHGSTPQRLAGTMSQQQQQQQQQEQQQDAASSVAIEDTKEEVHEGGGHGAPRGRQGRIVGNPTADRLWTTMSQQQQQPSRQEVVSSLRGDADEANQEEVQEAKTNAASGERQGRDSDEESMFSTDELEQVLGHRSEYK